MTTAEKIAVMQAFLDGKEIQIRTRGGNSCWDTLVGANPDWDWSRLEYRVKREPREFWLVLNEDGRGGAAYPTLSEAHMYCRVGGLERVRVREVLDENSVPEQRS